MRALSIATAGVILGFALAIALSGCAGNGPPPKFDPVKAALGTVIGAEVGAKLVIASKLCPDGVKPSFKDICSTAKMKDGANIGLPILQAAEMEIRSFLGSDDPAIADKVQEIADKAIAAFDKAQAE